MTDMNEWDNYYGIDDHDILEDALRALDKTLDNFNKRDITDEIIDHLDRRDF